MNTENTDFSLEELQLPYDQWTLLSQQRKPFLSKNILDWLNEWNKWDLACSPMDDTDRKLSRIGYYYEWISG